MLVSEFDYFLPPELIAQEPAEPRDSSRLLVVDHLQNTMLDRRFHQIPEFLDPGDLLIFNDTRVIPARLFAVKEGTEARLEVFLIREMKMNEWECLIRPGKRGKPGVKLIFPGQVVGEVTTAVPDGGRIVRFPAELDFKSWLAKAGETPLPPYIHNKQVDPERYQTIYARYEGSVAAPTAGLHFTGGLLEQLKAKGVNLGFLTLHVGLGTFRPVKTEIVEEHPMHAEYFTLPADLVDLIAATHQAGKRVIAVGTTVVRVLESQAQENGGLKAGTGETAIFIYPGYRFKVIDGLITNFHLPKSTLLMLVSAFAGREFIAECYKHAVADQYRFFSFGDAMFIK
ncbi:MAG TPA: tRNA preQ1(34) S-adenosylmethionine ribosyltransferase-isomerase QueA [Firmicutes bacterium]|jgi:S-adenosylmethionine:tRNA ribosyltransferase-isomerase|nr:tRNA preQ1(34) S-adenosylmethionine ribosyltransferase-isomerase QueA [Bacillota bacterium]